MIEMECKNTNMEYRILKVKDLHEFAIRDIRQNTVDKLKERIEKHGYNNSRPLTIVNKDGKYLVAAGNHRLKVLKNLKIEEVPCLIVDDDIYKVAINDNLDDDTYSPMNLFDYLNIIKIMKNGNYKREQISKYLNFTKDKLSKHYTLSLKVSDEILKKFNDLENELVPKDGTAVRFSEYWFRESGIYKLDEDYQNVFINSIIEDKIDISNKSKITKLSKFLYIQQEGIKYLEENIMKGADKVQLIDNINKGLYKDLDKIKDEVDSVNKAFLDKQKIQIKNQDCFDMFKELKDNSIDSIITDPPYFVTANEWDKFKSEEAFLNFLDKVLKESKRVLKEEYSLFIFMDSRYMAKLEELIIKNKFDLKSRIIWVRKNMSMGRVVSDKFISQWEVCFYCGNKQLNFPSNWGSERGDVQEFAVPQSNFNDKKIHPTQKPLELIKRFVELSTDINALVIDPFCGSGTTAKACEELNRKCITCDTNEDYIKIAEGRVFKNDK
jgi:site-specific DNA-methyltransferase (adenine-specific)